MKPRKTSRRNKTRKHHKGGYYGFSGAVATGAPLYKTEQEVPILGGRRRKHPKGKTHKRGKRGGGKYGGVSASYGGEGVAGMANFKGASTRVSSPGDVATFGKFNDGGAHSGDFSKFTGLLPK